MLVLCLAIAIAVAGGSVSLAGTAPSACALLVFHVGVVANLTLALALAGQFTGDVAPWLMGSWFAALAVVYAGHAFAVRNWGSPMSRTVFLFGLWKLPQFARTKPGLALAACPVVGVVFGAGWAAARFDVPYAGGARLAVYLGGAIVSLSCAAIAWRAARIRARSDLVLGLILGGYGPMSGPPPDDPSLGRRWQHGIVLAPRRATVILFVLDSSRPRNMSAFGYNRPTTPFLEALLARRGARAVSLAVSSSPSTEIAYWSLFSSRRPRHQAVNAPCLHDLLRAAGFTVRFFLSGAHRDWMGMQYLYGTDHDTFVDCLIDEQLVAEAGKLPDKPSATGDFLFFHLMSTHQASGCEPPPGLDAGAQPRRLFGDRRSRRGGPRADPQPLRQLGAPG